MRTVDILSGISVKQEGGVGPLLRNILRDFDRCGLNVRFLAPSEEDRISIRELARRGRWLSAMRLWYERRILGRGPLSTYVDSDHPLLVFHPQTLGFRRLLDLLERRRSAAWLYVLDSSFFCLRSRNSIPGEFDACLRCHAGGIGEAKKHGCSTRPYRFDASDLGRLRRLGQTGKVRFFVQNRGQRDLVNSWFGIDDAVQVGLDVLEEKQFHQSSEQGFDVVFHGAPTWAKGLGLFFRLAEAMPERSFCAPLSMNQSGAVLQKLGWTSPPDNVIFAPMKWGSGLRETVMDAKLVYCGTLWSAPVEGALLKSIQMNGAVLVTDAVAGYANDIPPECVMRLPLKDFKGTVESVRGLLDSADARQELRERAQTWFAGEQKRFEGMTARILAHLSPPKTP